MVETGHCPTCGKCSSCGREKPAEQAPWQYAVAANCVSEKRKDWNKVLGDWQVAAMDVICGFCMIIVVCLAVIAQLVIWVFKLQPWFILGGDNWGWKITAIAIVAIIACFATSIRCCQPALQSPGLSGLLRVAERVVKVFGILMCFLPLGIMAYDGVKGQPAPGQTNADPLELFGLAALSSVAITALHACIQHCGGKSGVVDSPRSCLQAASCSHGSLVHPPGGKVNPTWHCVLGR